MVFAFSARSRRGFRAGLAKWATVGALVFGVVRGSCRGLPGDRGLGAAAGRAQGKNVAPEAFVALKPVRVVCLSLLGAPRAADARRIRGFEIRLFGPP